MELRDALETLTDVGIVTDYANEYGEPGYSADGPVVLGDYWCHREECRGGGLHDFERHYPSEVAALRDAGAELEWYDEWYVDSETSRAWRTSADSYMWQSSLLWSEDACEYLTPDHDIADWLEVVTNNPRAALPSHVWTDDELAAEGFHERECGYENGWHPGQNDDPIAILASIHATEPDSDVIFRLSSVGQFDVSFCVYVRTADDSEAVDA